MHRYYRKRGRSVSGFILVLFVGRNYVLINLRKEAAHKQNLSSEVAPFGHLAGDDNKS